MSTSLQMHYKSVKKIKSSFLVFQNRWIDLELEDVIGGLLEEINLVSVRTGQNSFGLKMSLHKPIYSLTQVFQETLPYPVVMWESLIWRLDTYIPDSVKNWIWGYYVLLPNHYVELLPPFNRTAMVISDTEILTFDGAVLRVPRSQCKVLLTSLPEKVDVYMSHPSSSAPAQITVQTPAVKAVIKPDFSVEVNGQPVTSKTTVGDVTIQPGPSDVTMVSPYLGIQVYKERRVIAVNVSGWAFGKVLGLLGTYDGELANDWRTKSGRNATSYQELVHSWQEDSECQTPSILPGTKYNLAAEARCHTVLGIRSLCSPLVSEKPFIKMCYASHSPCDLAYAYRKLCAKRGIKSLFPIVC